MSPIAEPSFVVRVPMLGKIRLGIKKRRDNGDTYAVLTNYFVCPDEVKKVFGEKPKELQIMFLTEDREKWANLHLRRYSLSCPAR